MLKKSYFLDASVKKLFLRCTEPWAIHQGNLFQCELSISKFHSWKMVEWQKFISIQCNWTIVWRQLFGFILLIPFRWSIILISFWWQFFLPFVIFFAGSGKRGQLSPPIVSFLLQNQKEKSRFLWLQNILQIFFLSLICFYCKSREGRWKECTCSLENKVYFEKAGRKSLFD